MELRDQAYHSCIERLLMADALPPASGEHVTIFAAIERRDAAASVAALRAHRESAQRRALGFEVNDDTRHTAPAWRTA